MNRIIKTDRIFKKILEKDSGITFHIGDTCFISLNESNNIFGWIQYHTKSYFAWSTKQVYKQYNPKIFIKSFFVEPKYRGIGIGKLLFDTVIKKYSQIGLATSYYEIGTNQAAFNIYKSYNFKVIGNRKNWGVLYWYLDKDSNINEVEYNSNTYLQIY